MNFDIIQSFFFPHSFELIHMGKYVTVISKIDNGLAILRHM